MAAIDDASGSSPDQLAAFVKLRREGESFKKSTDHPVVTGISKPADFPSVEEFERRKEEYDKKGINPWRVAMNIVRSDDRIIGCYQFWRY